MISTEHTDETSLRKSHPIPPQILLDSVDVSSQIAAGFEIVPAAPVNLQNISGVTGELLEHQRKLLQSSAVRAVPEHFTWISKGLEGGIGSNWWELPRSPLLEPLAIPLHIERQDRHPALRLFSPEGSEMLSIGIKGGGLRSKQGAPILDFDALKKDRYPFYRLRGEYAESVEIPSHKYWGALTLTDGRAEFLNTITIHHLCSAIDPAHPPPVPTALGLSVMLSIPGWENGRTKWRTQREYLADICDEDRSVDRSILLATLRTSTPSDVRLSQLVNRVFEQPAEEFNIERLELRIQETLQYLYRVHGEDLTWPTTQIPITGTTIGPGEIAAFLRRVYQENSEAANRIFSTIANHTLTVMGAVHGTGGTLGGSRVSKELQIGAVSGGSMAIRNIDAAGYVHDFDRDILLPWIARDGESQRNRLAMLEYAPGFQLSDVKYWRDTIYWSEILLKGNDRHLGRGLVEEKVGPYDRFKRLGEFDSRYQFSRIKPEFDARRNIRLNIDEFLGTDQWRDLYRTRFDAGRRFRNERR